MHDKTVTVFCHVGDIWRATVLNNVYFAGHNNITVSTDGEKASDEYLLMIDIDEGVAAKYIKPKAFEVYEGEDKFTLREGDIVALGEYESGNDLEYMEYGGFLSYMKSKYDDVYSISSIKRFDVIPHFEVTVK